MSEELKACPFCGGIADIDISEQTRDSFGFPIDIQQVFCLSCGCETHFFVNLNDAITAWNRRVES